MVVVGHHNLDSAPFTPPYPSLGSYLTFQAPLSGMGAVRSSARGGLAGRPAVQLSLGCREEGGETHRYNKNTPSGSVFSGSNCPGFSFFSLTLVSPCLVLSLRPRRSHRFPAETTGQIR